MVHSLLRASRQPLEPMCWQLRMEKKKKKVFFQILPFHNKVHVFWERGVGVWHTSRYCISNSFIMKSHPGKSPFQKLLEKLVAIINTSTLTSIQNARIFTKAAFQIWKLDRLPSDPNFDFPEHSIILISMLLTTFYLHLHSQLCACQLKIEIIFL